MFKEEINSLGFIEAHPKPSSTELREFYQEQYYQNQNSQYSHSYSEDEIRYFTNIARVGERTARKYGLKRETLIELGCGEGFFSRFFFEKGWEVTCCDYSDYGLRMFNEELIPNFKKGDISEIIESFANEQKRFAFINLSNVLEHVLDPLELLSKLRAITDNHAIVRCDVPNDYSDFQRLMWEKGFTENTWFCPPQHLSYFNNKNLPSVLEACGYKVISLQVGFPIEVFLSNEHSNYALNRQLGKGAHLARVVCTNYLIETDIDAYVDYCESGARLGFGRDLVVYAVPLAQA